MQFKRIVLMKYGVHASESVESIITRKQEELAVNGRFFWGYGGVVCHPIKQIIPFLQQDSNDDGTYLLLSRTPSNFNNQPKPAKLCSIDGDNWENIPSGISVYGSKYALSCTSLKQCNFDIDLSSYIVGIGPSYGRLLSDYIGGRIDKGCGLLQPKLFALTKEISLPITWYAKITGAYLLR